MQNEPTESQLAYIHGRFESQLEGFANSLGVPYKQLAGWLASLLQRSAGGALLGPADSLQGLPGPTTAGPAGQPTLALASGARDNTSAHKSRSKKLKAYWSRMTPAERSAEMRYRRERRSPSKRRRAA